MNAELHWMDQMAGLDIRSFMEIVNQMTKMVTAIGGVMFQANNLNNKIISSFKIDYVIKINEDNYGKFLDKIFLKWLKFTFKKS